MDYDAPQRVDWHFIPKASRKGLQIREMTEDQRQGARNLLRASLSEIGYGKATRIMEFEALLKELEKAKTGTPLRDSERYYFTVFGQPSETSKWGLSIEGHHYSFNFVVEKGRVVSSTPIMFGANPAMIKASPLPGFKVGERLLAKEEQLAFDLLAALDPAQRKTAVIAEKALDEVRTAGQPLPPTDAPAGLAAANMTEPQQKLLRSLVEAYAENMPDEVAASRSCTSLGREPTSRASATTTECKAKRSSSNSSTPSPMRLAIRPTISIAHGAIAAATSRFRSSSPPCWHSQSEELASLSGFPLTR
jgi:hypothetical protein